MRRGGYRIRASDLSVVEARNGVLSRLDTSVPSLLGEKSKVKFPEAVEVAKLFKKHGNLGLIVDDKDKRFLKGGFSNGKVVGARIKVLPDGRCLNKMYSLFAPDLKVHDERSNIHWDVICRNPNGAYSYAYTLEKEGVARKAKYERVVKFGECLSKLRRNLDKVLDTDAIALPMLVLLKTRMRVGNEIYYNRNHHKGLTTLKKKNVKISGNKVSFDFIGKDGVPQKIVECFSVKIILELKKVLRSKKLDDFIFVDLNNRPLKDVAFERGFEKYCGVSFYPHIVRSYYATSEAEKFLRKGTVSKDEVKKFYLRVADKLGHKKFSKKTGDWEDSYQVTLHHYIRPELVEKIAKVTCA